MSEEVKCICLLFWIRRGHSNNYVTNEMEKIWSPPSTRNAFTYFNSNYEHPKGGGHIFEIKFSVVATKI